MRTRKEIEVDCDDLDFVDEPMSSARRANDLQMEVLLDIRDLLNQKEV